MRKGAVAAVCGVCVVVIVAANVAIWHRASRRPELLFELRREECPDLPFGGAGIEWHVMEGAAVDAVCGERGFESGPFFALLGRRVVRWERDVEGRCVHIRCEPGEDGVVYFYRYSTKCRRIVEGGGNEG